MAEPLKLFFSPALVRRLGEALARVWPNFLREAFERSASEGLSRMELMDRARHIAEALGDALPSDYPEAVGVLLRSLGPEHQTDELVGTGLSPFFYLPHTLFVAERGLGHFELSMEAQYELTKRFTAEGSIRPFIAKYPDRTFAVFRKSTKDRNPHVRRLVSEGTRLRLPWAMRVPWLDAHPEQILELLELLQDDPATLVRRSVANNLNDLWRVHPKLMIATCRRWLSGASQERRALVEHALRGAIKKGDPSALALLGFGKAPAVKVKGVRFTPRRVAIGGSVTVSFGLENSLRKGQDVLVDMVVHFVKANGRSAPKVFKLKKMTLPVRGKEQISGRVSLAVHTTRKPQPGKHRVDIQVNGHTFPIGAFAVVKSR
ncbi:MAG: DNA alkylation repair protein [Myxococcaceae bacterium]